MTFVFSLKNFTSKIFITKPQLKSYLQSTCLYKKIQLIHQNTIHSQILKIEVTLSATMIKFLPLEF